MGVFKLRKDDVLELSALSIECVIGKKDGTTLVFLKGGNVLNVPSGMFTTEKLLQVWRTAKQQVKNNGKDKN